jgi:hypothetical protein
MEIHLHTCGMQGFDLKEHIDHTTVVRRERYIEGDDMKVGRNGYWLLVIGCWLLVVGCWLPVAGC